MKKVIIFSAPSGSGKTTLVKYALEEFPELCFSISCTTRQLRGNEKNGVDYHFISPQDFKQKIENNEFVEYEEVYEDKCYGTLKNEIERIWKEGKTVIFDVDVKGGVSLKKYFKEQALSIFILPPSIEELERRLNYRGTDDVETIKTRVDKAAEEISYQDEFDVKIINEDLEIAKSEVKCLIGKFIRY